jgi:Tol biopolymer transport system component
MRAAPARALLAAAIVVASATPAEASDALNGRIAYTTHGLDGTGEIFSIDPDGSHPLRLTEHPGYDAQSDWSPDGKSIVYRRSPTTTGFEVWRMTAEGEHETRMTFGLDLPTGAYSSSQPAWAPDGERILFRASGGPFAIAPIFTMPNAPGAEKQLLLQAEVPLWYPALSPDGSRLLVAAQYPRINRREDRAVEIVDSPFTGPRRVVFDGAKSSPGVYDSAGNWSPDGGEIAFESDIDGDMDIYVIGADGTGLRQLTGVEPDGNAHDEGPSWSPDGLQLAFTSGPDNLNGDIHVMDAADGSDVRRITFNESPIRLWGRDESPDWQAIPIGEDLRPLGDLVTSGPGVYSLHAGGDLTDARARRLAQLWSRLAAHGIRLKVLAGLRMTREDVGPGDTAVRGTPIGRDRGRRLAFLYREG